MRNEHPAGKRDYIFAACLGDEKMSTRQEKQKTFLLHVSGDAKMSTGRNKKRFFATRLRRCKDMLKDGSSQIKRKRQYSATMLLMIVTGEENATGFQENTGLHRRRIGRLQRSF